MLLFYWYRQSLNIYYLLACGLNRPKLRVAPNKLSKNTFDMLKNNKLNKTTSIGERTEVFVLH
jgi:hypothetical protein